MKGCLFLLVLVVLAGFMFWHVFYWLAVMQGAQLPGLVAWVLAPPFGAWLVFKS